MRTLKIIIITTKDSTWTHHIIVLYVNRMQANTVRLHHLLYKTRTYLRLWCYCLKVTACKCIRFVRYRNYTCVNNYCYISKLITIYKMITFESLQYKSIFILYLTYYMYGRYTHYVRNRYANKGRWLYYNLKHVIYIYLKLLLSNRQNIFLYITCYFTYIHIYTIILYYIYYLSTKLII